ncbi:MAG TPA: hypothetical protein P5539_14260 [Mesotoga sp.]|nr:hypothetical protein [Mesotoga sp.]
MRKLVTFLVVFVLVVSVFSVTIAPSFTYRSDGEHLAELAVGLGLDALTLDIVGEYLIKDNTLGIDAIAKMSRELGDLKVGIFIDTPLSSFATPTLGFHYKSAAIGPEYFKLFAELGTGHYTDAKFGIDLLGDFIANQKDVSGVVKLGSEFELAKLEFDAFVGAGYYLLDETYSVYANVETKLFDFLDVAAKFDIVPVFAFSVKASTIIEF